MPSPPIDNLTLQFIARTLPRCGIRVRRDWGFFLNTAGKPTPNMSHISVCAACALIEETLMVPPQAVEFTYYLVKKGTRVMRCQRCRHLLHKRRMEELCPAPSTT